MPFGGSGNSNLIPFLNDLKEVSDKFVKAGKFSNPSGTAPQLMAYGLGSTITGHVLADDFITPLKLIGIAFGAAGAAKLLSMPATLASTTRLTRAYYALVKTRVPQRL